MSDRLDPLFLPRRIGIAGLSPRPETWGNRLLVNLGRGGFEGEVIAVAPRSEVPVPSVADLADLDEPLDLLLVTLPGPAVPALVTRARETGKARSIIVYSAGFREEGNDELEDALAEAAGDVPLVGPNCLGVISVPGSTVATVSAYVDRAHPPAGPVAIVSQSGALGMVMAALFERHGVGLGTFVSVGNEASMGVADFGAHLVERPDVAVLGLYIESVRDADGLRALGRRAAELGKRVIALKAGQSDAGRRATLSHTAAVAGDALLFHSLCTDAGIIAATSDDDFADLLHAAQRPGRLPASPRLAIATMSGGAGAILADRLATRGVAVPPLSEATRARLADLELLAIASDGNPVDLGGGFDRDHDKIGDVFRVLAADPEIDGIVGMFTFGDRRKDWYLELTAELAALPKPAWMIWNAGLAEHYAEAEPGVVFDTIEGFVRGLPAVRSTPPVAAAAGSGDGGAGAAAVRALAAYDGAAVLSEADAHTVVRALGVPYVATAVASTATELAATSGELPDGAAYVVKVDSPGVAHRAKLGLVRLGVARGDLAAVAGELAAEAAAQGVTDFRLVAQPMLEHRGELVVGAVRDPQYGPALILGAGGAKVEDGDSHRHGLLVPLNPEALASAVSDLSNRHGGLDKDALTELATATADLMLAAPGLTELDVNPVLIRPDGSLTAVDALIIQGDGSPGKAGA